VRRLASEVPHEVGCLHPAHAKSLDLLLSALEPSNDGIIQIIVRKIGLVLFEHEYIRVYLSIISESHLLRRAPGGKPRRVSTARHTASWSWQSAARPARDASRRHPRVSSQMSPPLGKSQCMGSSGFLSLLFAEQFNFIIPLVSRVPSAFSRT